MQDISGSLVNLGKLLMTRGVSELMEKDDKFMDRVIKSFARYTGGDWGELCEEDKQASDDALKCGERLFAKYDIEPKSIYIITEWDRSVTTILFPEEY